ncbi:MAG: hypothetical protein PUP91_03355 [Rhizonema sp. PD37]|nr:hypothetical protein [Rhizonema sp. PD37]
MSLEARSHPEIIRYNNALFGRVKTNRLYLVTSVADNNILPVAES